MKNRLLEQKNGNSWQLLDYGIFLDYEDNFWDYVIYMKINTYLLLVK